MPQHILRGVGAARHQRRQFDRRRRRFDQCPLPRVRLIFRRRATSFVAFAMASMLFMSLPMTFATFRALFISLACRAPRLCRRLPCLSRLSRLPWFFRRPLRFAHIRHCFPSIVRKNWRARGALRIWVASCMTCRQSSGRNRNSYMSMHTISVTGDCVSGVQFMARSHAVRVGVVTVIGPTSVTCSSGACRLKTLTLRPYLAVR